MKQLNTLFLLFLIIAFFIGLRFYLKLNIEPMENADEKDEETIPKTCYDLLINKGDVILLYNTREPEVDGVNPIPFYNLDEYINYLEIQRKKGNKCPVLYLQQETTAQGKDVYRVRPSPFDQQGGLQVVADTPYLPTGISQDPNKPIEIMDASRDNPPYNAGNYAGFDPYGLHIGNFTELDKIHESGATSSGMSDNPMDLNWGGVMYTQQMVDSGKYDDYNVYKPNNPNYPKQFQ